VVPVFGSGDKICVGGVAFRLRLLLALLLHAALSERLGDVLLLASLRLLVLPEDGLDRLMARGELGGDVHQLARPSGSLATQLAHQVAASGAGCSPVGILPAAGGSFGDPRSSQGARMCPGSFRRRL
jgi:hypothetical protein